MLSDAEWRSWGAVDPLYAVASWEGKDLHSLGAWTEEEFLGLGASDMADVLSHWRHYGLVPGRCVDIGCGAGRMTGLLVEAFGSVLALDVSADQIARAQRHHPHARGSVEVRVVDRPRIPTPADSCSGMFSCHVFQHFSEFNGVVTYLRETFRVLCAGGTTCFHIPVKGAHLDSTQSSLRLGLRNIRAKLGRLVGVGRTWEYHRHDPRSIILTLADIGFESIELRVFPMRSNGDHHSYFFARKG
jgi:cyclopropane fatty-acyl-phospholipid synthase-like methyltransferase